MAVLGASSEWARDQSIRLIASRQGTSARKQYLELSRVTTLTLPSQRRSQSLKLLTESSFGNRPFVQPTLYQLYSGI
jgi:hypothetical protein